MKKTLLAAALLVGLAQGHPIEAPSAWAPAPVCAIGSVSYLDKPPLPDWLANAQTLAPDWLQLRDWPSLVGRHDRSPAVRALVAILNDRKNPCATAEQLYLLLDQAPTAAGQLMLLAALQQVDSRRGFDRQKSRLKLATSVREAGSGKTQTAGQWLTVIEKQLTPNFDSSEAEALITAAPQLENRRLGREQRLSYRWAAFNVLAHDEQGAETFERILPEATPAGQLYALHGLLALEPGRFCALQSQLPRAAKVRVLSGDSRRELTAGALLDELNRTVDCDRERRMEVERAMGRLLKTTQMEGERVGFFDRKSRPWAALQLILRQADAAERLEQIFRQAAQPAGQLYALQGLATVAPARFCALRSQLAPDLGVREQTFDRLNEVRAAELIAQYGKNIDCGRLEAPGQPAP